MTQSLPGISDIKDAAGRLAGVAVQTPLLEFPALNQAVGGRLLFKAEIFQITGSFKFRGAYNRISRLTADERRSGVVAWSSGNHAQGVAAAAKQVGTPALIVMPDDTPPIKIEKTRALGAEIVFYDRWREDREVIGRRYARARGAVVVPPFDDPQVIAGQGTIGLEIAGQITEAGYAPDVVVVPCGGGGLIAGVGIALKNAFPDILIYGVEPDAFDDTARSLESGRRETNPLDRRVSICDALLAPQPGELTFAVNRNNLTGVAVVSDSEVKEAMVLAFKDLKLVLEPGGAVGLAAVLSGRISVHGRTVVIILSGGNVEPRLFAEIIQD